MTVRFYRFDGFGKTWKLKLCKRRPRENEGHIEVDEWHNDKTGWWVKIVHGGVAIIFHSKELLLIANLLKSMGKPKGEVED